jgi:hypothetical protein
LHLQGRTVEALGPSVGRVRSTSLQEDDGREVAAIEELHRTAQKAIA